MINLIKYPITNQIPYKDTFAGFAGVELEFKRKDAFIVGVGAGLDNNILVSIIGNVLINIGDYIYVYSEKFNIKYDGVFEVLDSQSGNTTDVLCKFQYIGNTDGGYVNYKQNYYVETKLVNPYNNNVLVYPTTLKQSGTPAGVVKCDVSAPVDFLKEQIKDYSGELEDGRVELQVMFREVWRENQTNLFELINEKSIVITYALENSDIETFIKGFDVPKIYEDYRFSLRFLHSIKNLLSSERIAVYYDELDINKNIISQDNAIHKYNVGDFGFLEIYFEPQSINENTQYIDFKVIKEPSPDYEKVDYKDIDYLT